MSSIFALTSWSAWSGTGLGLCASAYACLSLWAWFRTERGAKHRQAEVNEQASQSVSVLKPLHGDEPDLYGNLRSFCIQDYPNYEVLFGVRAADDTAIAVVQRLQREFPNLPIRLVVDSRVHGANLKVSNLINLRGHAKHEWLVLADSDIQVPADYLSRVTFPLHDATIGIVTCLYHGITSQRLVSRMGSLFIDDWFAPSVRLARAFGSTHVGFGATIALRMNTLDAIGGFEALRDTLADDYWLGELTRQRGLRTILSDLVVGTTIGEDEWPALWRHELRWLRTIRAISPSGFFFSVVCFSWPLWLLSLLLSPTWPCLFVAACGAAARILRYACGWRRTRRSSPLRDIWLTPFRDTLLLLEWGCALMRWRVHWRGQVLHARDHAPSRYP